MSTDIPNIQKYTVEMRKSLIDKVFFFDKVNIDVLVDYGCADGVLCGFISTIFPECRCIGYDINADMINLAQKNYPSLTFISQWCDVQALVRTAHQKKQKVGILLSSIVHEIYSYLSVNGVNGFWHQIFALNCEYVILRDMIPSTTIDRVADFNDTIKVRRTANAGMLYEFENKWGSIDHNKNLIHFLLKYRYTENWKREVQENYLPLFLEDLPTRIPSTYKSIYNEHFVLPFLFDEIEKDFAIEIKDKTHFKLILRKCAR